MDICDDYCSEGRRGGRGVWGGNGVGQERGRRGKRCGGKEVGQWYLIKGEEKEAQINIGKEGLNERFYSIGSHTASSQ